MKIILEDGEEQVCSPDHQRDISVLAPLIRPQRVPKDFKRISSNPPTAPTYAKLITVRCDLIVAGHWVFTGYGLKRVVKVEK